MTPNPATSATSAAAFALDVSRFPQAYLVMRGAMSVADAAAMTHALEADVFARGQRYSLLIDATYAGVPGAEVRRYLAAFASKHKDFRRRNCVGEAYVLPSPLLRGALTAIMWIAPFEYPHKIFATVPEASAWLETLRA